MQRDIFHAIADQTRRDILGIIAYNNVNINAVSGKFKISRAAVYKHIKVLKEAGLLEIEQKGRERFCRAKMDGLKNVADWLEQYKKLWNNRIDSLEKYLNELQTKK